MATLTCPELEDQQPAGDRILGAEGVLASCLPGYEPRQQQVEMANLCEEVIRDGGHALIEAATGTGKSLAYLIPAILSGKKTIVSTDTIQLQEQLVGKDLPFLARTLGVEFTYAIAKGRSNFLCLRNTVGLLEEKALLQEYERELVSLDAQQCLDEFRADRWDGDRAHLKLPVQDARWSLLSGEESCTGKSCEHARECPYLRAKAKFEEADIVVTNHTMYMLHHCLKSRTGGAVGVLPEHTVWIADEAHTVADNACDTFGLEISDRTPAAFVKRIRRQVKRLKLSIPEKDLDLESVQRAADGFFELWTGAVKQEQLLAEFPTEILDLGRDLKDVLVSRIKPIRVALHWAMMGVPIEDYETRGAIERLYSAADDLTDGLDILLDPEPDPDHVRFVEIGNAHGKRTVTLNWKPIETRPIFQRHILPSLSSVVFTSATLATGTGPRAFLPAADEMGVSLGEARVLQADSPFDYARQVTGYIPKSMPRGDAPEYHTAVADEVTAVLNHTQGRAFVLFTSIRDMHRVYELVRAKVRFPLLIQGEASKDLLVEEFKSTPNSVLFGVRTFWTGVDIPGESLSCVILVKLPFPVHTHPLNAARSARIEARGGNSFRDFSLPRCVRDVKQGFGRLIRCKTDTGLFVLLDPRMRTARYGAEIAANLPAFQCRSTLG